MYDIKKFSVPKHYIRPFYSPAIVAILFAFVKKSYPFAMPSLNYPLLLLLFEIQSLSLNACFWIKKRFILLLKLHILHNGKRIIFLYRVNLTSFRLQLYFIYISNQYS